MKKFDYEEFKNLILPTESEIMMNWQGDLSQPIVSLVCITYNQEKYIKDTLKGFLIQKTVYPFEIIIHDDASTDKTVAIIKEYYEKYPSIIKLVLQEKNQYSQGKKVTPMAVNYANGEYIALCEGDDFWIDEYKLQKQIDVFLKNTNISLVHSNCFDLIERDSLFVKSLVPNKINTFETLIKVNRIRTLTVMFPLKLYKQYLNEFHSDLNKWSLGDWPLWLYLSLSGNIHMLSDDTSVYRVLEESASHIVDIEKHKMFIYSTLIMRKFFIKQYGFNCLYKYIGNGNIKSFLMLGIPLDYELIGYASIKYKIIFHINKYIPLRWFLIRVKKIIENFSFVF